MVEIERLLLQGAQSRSGGSDSDPQVPRVPLFVAERTGPPSVTPAMMAELARYRRAQLQAENPDWGTQLQVVYVGDQLEVEDEANHSTPPASEPAIDLGETFVERLHSGTGGRVLYSDRASRPAVELGAIARVQNYAEYVRSDFLQCAVCLDEFELRSDAREMPCGHMFHSDCIQLWLGWQRSCPLCRYQIPIDEEDNTEGYFEDDAEDHNDPWALIRNVYQHVGRMIIRMIPWMMQIHG